jgi:hypothetical protein
MKADGGKVRFTVHRVQMVQLATIDNVEIARFILCLLTPELLNS